MFANFKQRQQQKNCVKLAKTISAWNGYAYEDLKTPTCTKPRQLDFIC